MVERIVIQVLMLLFTPAILAQESSEMIIGQLLAKYLIEDSELDADLLAEELESLMRHPLNINTASKEDLRRVFFLDDASIDAILAYRDSFGALLSVYELAVIDGIPVEMARNLLPFVNLDAEQRSDTRPLELDMSLISQAALPLETESGSPARLRLTINAESGRFSLRFMAEQDKGELPDNIGKLPLPDHIAGNLLWEGEKSRLQLGSLALDFGNGNVFASNTQISPVQIGNENRTSYRIRNGGLSRESGNISGLAAQYRSGSLSVFGVLGNTTRDGEFVDENIPEPLNFDASGYHNTATSRLRANALKEKQVSAGVAWEGKQVNAAMLSSRFLISDSLRQFPISLHAGSLVFRSRSLRAGMELNLLNNNGILFSTGLTMRHSDGLSASLWLAGRSPGLNWVEDFRPGGRIGHDRQMSLSIRMQTARDKSLTISLEARQDRDISGHLAIPIIRSLITFETCADNPVRINLGIPATNPETARLSLRYDYSLSNENSLSMALSLSGTGCLAMCAWSSNILPQLRLKARLHIWSILDDGPMLYAWQNDVAGLGRTASFTGKGQQLSLALRLGRRNRFEAGLIMRQNDGLSLPKHSSKVAAEAPRLELSISLNAGT